MSGFDDGDLLLAILTDAHQRMDRLGYPPATGHRAWRNPRRAHRAKLTDDQRRTVATRYQRGATLASLAADYGVSEATISRAVAFVRRLG